MSRPAPVRVDLDPADVGRGLAELVLIVLDLLRELLERQAIRRVENGDLSDEQIEALGTALRAAAEQLNALHTSVAGRPPAGAVTNPIREGKP